MTAPNPSPQRRPFWVLFTFIALASAGLVVWLSLERATSSKAARFVEMMNAGKNYYDNGEPGKAVEALQRAVELAPAHAEARLNLAKSCLLAGLADQALREADRVLALEPASPAAFYIKGCALLRLGVPEEAVKVLQQTVAADPGVAAAQFQLGVAHQQLRQWEEAEAAFQAVVSLEPEHPSAHYNLSQVLVRLDRTDEASEALEIHRLIAPPGGTASLGPADFERCVYTEIQVPFELEQPDEKGIPVQFADMTEAFFGGSATNLQGPLGVMDLNYDGVPDLFLREREGFRVWSAREGRLEPFGSALPVPDGAQFSQCLVGDLQNDRVEDVILLGNEQTRVFQIATNGLHSDTTSLSGLGSLAATGGALADLDFTGKLDLIAVTTSNELRVFRNLGEMLFQDHTATSGIPASAAPAKNLTVNDWNDNDLMDLFVAQQDLPPLLLLKERGGPLVATNLPLPSVNALRILSGDLNNDLRMDALLILRDKIEIVLAGLDNRISFPHDQPQVQTAALIDYDNDGWLDLLLAGEGVQLFRNLGLKGFADVTRATGLGQATAGLRVTGIAAADFDNDGDSDLVLALDSAAGSAGLRAFKNNGGNANLQVKVRLRGNRSNASGLGVRLEIAAGGMRQARTISQVPAEIGVGRHDKLDSLTLRWFDLAVPSVDLAVDPSQQLVFTELILPTGSCPNLYAWDGSSFRFITDLLGAAPAGLPVAAGKLIDADIDELAWVGTEESFPPKEGAYVLQITEELREVLYLDEAKLVVVDHPENTEVVALDRLLPGKPFPPSAVTTLHQRIPLQHAIRSDDKEVTADLRDADRKYVSPVKLRLPQLRGLADPFHVVLDFGPLDPRAPLALALNGWLRFGGGMANVAASHHASLPFPFPTLEVEVEGKWLPLDVRAGAPSGKTKEFLIDLEGRIPDRARRLRLSTAFEIHWDRIALFEKRTEPDTVVTWVAPEAANLHWRGFSPYLETPWYEPLTPDYNQVYQRPFWRITPSGWCTRYGEVKELVLEADDALVLLNGGDELTLRFPADALPPKPPGTRRTFFLHTVGWDKDADYHVVKGWTVEPLPFRGMDDQKYGVEERPVIAEDWWIKKYNTRWVGPITLDRASR